MDYAFKGIIGLILLEFKEHFIDILEGLTIDENGVCLDRYYRES